MVGDDVWEYQSSDYQEAPSYLKLTLKKLRFSVLAHSLGKKPQFVKSDFVSFQLAQPQHVHFLNKNLYLLTDFIHFAY